MTVRAPQLQQTLRNFCLGAFLALQREVDAGADVPFAFEAHATLGRRPSTSTGRSSAASSRRARTSCGR